MEWKYLMFYIGLLYGVEVVVVKCGIGKVVVVVVIIVLVDWFVLDYVVNMGLVGGFDIDLNIGDLVIVIFVLYYDIDIIYFGYMFG